MLDIKDDNGLLPRDYALKREGWGGSLLKLLGMRKKEIKKIELLAEEKAAQTEETEEAEEEEEEVEMMVDDSPDMLELVQAIIKVDLEQINSLLDSGKVSVRGFDFFSFFFIRRM